MQLASGPDPVWSKYSGGSKTKEAMSVVLMNDTEATRRIRTRKRGVTRNEVTQS
jgi:hypothetical protein